MKLAIARGLDLPLDAVTQKLAFMGKTGSGKTYGASKLVEQMLDAGAQVVVLDPVGAWHGLRLPGTGPGYEIPVLGGLHGAIPLEHTAGAVVAELVAMRHLSAVLDVSQMTGTEQARFAADFATRFFELKKASASAVHLVIEECQEFAPQNVQPGEQRMLHAFERLVKLGRNAGIGVSLISQRPQEVNKKCLNQTECLFAFQMTGPQERKAMAAWMTDKGAETGLVDALPGLQPGHCFVWSPSWLDVSKQVHILPKRSADASSTPKVGAAARPTQKLTPIDLGQLLGEMAETIEHAKADDPAALKKEIGQLKEALAHAPVLPPSPSLKPEEWAKVERATEMLEALREPLKEATDAISGLVLAISRATSTQRDSNPVETLASRPAAHRDSKPAKVPMHGMRLKPEAEWPKISPPRAPSPPRATSGGSKLKRGERAILDTLVRHPKGLARGVLAARAGLTADSGTFSTYLAVLRREQLIIGSEILQASPAGIAASPLAGGAPTSRKEILEHWSGAMKAGGRRMLEQVLAAPAGLTREELARRSEMDAGSGTFSTYLAVLRRHLLITGGTPIRLGPALEGTR